MTKTQKEKTPSFLHSREVKPPTDNLQATPDPTTPEEVLRYLELREQREVIEAAIKELEPTVIKWGEKQIRELRLTDKTLPIPELEEKGKALSITEKEVYNKKDPDLLLLEEMIDEQKNVARRKNQKRINELMAGIQSLKELLELESITPQGFELMQKRDKIIERITRPVKGLMLRNVKGKG